MQVPEECEKSSKSRMIPPNEHLQLARIFLPKMVILEPPWIEAMMGWMDAKVVAGTTIIDILFVSCVSGNLKYMDLTPEFNKGEATSTSDWLDKN